MNIKKYINDKKGDFIYLSSSIINPFVGMLNAIVASRYIEPNIMGVVNSTLLISSYASFAQLGVFNGLNRNIAYYKAKSDEERVQSMVDTSYLVAILITLVSFVLSFIYFIYTCFYGSFILSASAFLLCIVLLTTNMTTHFDVTFRSGEEFKMLGIIKSKESVLSLVLCILPVFFNYIGYIIGYICRQLYGLYLRFKNRVYIYKKKQTFTSYKSLLEAGWPLLFGGYVWSIFSVADQTFISLNMTSEEMGLYNIARQCTTAIMVVPNAINTLLYPKAAALFGKTDDPRTLRPFIWKSLFLYIGVMLPICIAGYFFIPVFVESFLPKYVNGIRAAQISLLTGFTYIYFGPSVVFGVLKKNMAFNILILLLLGMFWVVAICFDKYILSINDIALLRLSFFVALMLVTILLSFYYCRK